MDRGPWYVYADPRSRTMGVASEDWQHDVRLAVTGDFEDVAARKRYCEWLRDKLNSAASTSNAVQEETQ